ncbi:hypothetical protein PAMA_001868 [Pampus argenteus]
MEDVSAGQRKRKASPDKETPKKRHRGSCSEHSSVLVEDVQHGQRKRKASTDEETPRKRQKSSELKQSSCRAVAIKHIKGTDVDSKHSILMNLLVKVGSSVPCVRIIDFGCGCSVQREPFNYFCGTLSFAPPE